MLNVDVGLAVTKSSQNPDGGFTYSVTFAASMGDVPALTVHTSDLPIAVATSREGNILGGSFRLTLGDETTGDIAHDATALDMQDSLQFLDNVGLVSVSRSAADDQGGYTWTIEFIDDINTGNVDLLTTNAGGLTTTYSSATTPTVTVTEADGNYVSGTFVLDYNTSGNTPAIPVSASAKDMKDALEQLSTIPVGSISVSRSDVDTQGGYTWTVTFLPDAQVPDTHAGVLPEITYTDTGLSSTGTIAVATTRPGTVVETQTLTVTKGGGAVNAAAAFKLKFDGEETSSITYPASCDGIVREQQLISTRTVDTTSIGGDNSVSELTSFTVTYAGETSGSMTTGSANDCATQGAAIESALELMTVFAGGVTVGASAGSSDCDFTVTFDSIDGDMTSLLQVTGSYLSETVGPSTSSTVGDDTISVSAVTDGSNHIIKSNLEALTTVGVVTVSDDGVTSAADGCVWTVTFGSNAGSGGFPQLEVLGYDATATTWSAAGSTANAVNGADTDTFAVADGVSGTSSVLSGEFTLEFDGQRTGYLSYDISAANLEAALDALSTVGDVDVSRSNVDENGGYTWSVTFLSNLGDVSELIPDGLDIVGTAATVSVAQHTVGVPPPFNSAEYNSVTITDLSKLNTVATSLRQGIPYYFRVAAMNAMGTGPSANAYPPYALPLPSPPSAPTDVTLDVVDGNSLSVSIGAPDLAGGPVEEIEQYLIEYSTNAFDDEVQQVSISCPDIVTEVQTITTVATVVGTTGDWKEQQVIALSTTNTGATTNEIQTIECDATGGTFGLTYEGETAHVAYDATDTEIKSALEDLSSITTVNVVVNNGITACLPHAGVGGALDAGEFTVEFVSGVKFAGNVAELVPSTNSLEGGRVVLVGETTPGDAPIGGSFKLVFRGQVTVAIDASEATRATTATAIQTALNNLDTVSSAGVAVTHLINDGGDKQAYMVTFSGAGVGGNVEAIRVVAADADADASVALTGTAAAVTVFSDGDDFLGTHTSVKGSELLGSFALTLRGHTTSPIDFNAADTTVKARLEALDNVGTVDVTRSASSEELGYVWSVTFTSNPGYFPVGARNVDQMTADFSALTTTNPARSGASATTGTTDQGSPPLAGTFQLSFNDGTTTLQTVPIDNFASSSAVQAALEALDNVGRTTVTRTVSGDGYSWFVTFSGCDADAAGGTAGGNDVCNVGPQIDMTIASSLTGCGATLTPAVATTVPGSGPSNCASRASGLCKDTITAITSSNTPTVYDIESLITGTPYYVRVSARNAQSFGARRLSSPSYATPMNSAPGAPRPVVLLSTSVTSSASTISVEWSLPTVNGGAAVSGYELWMDEWNGGASAMIYDGTGNLATAHTVSTGDQGPLNQVVESGRQYRFMVRALNYCDDTDTDLVCHGEFSPVSIFTVRAPRVPLAPARPTRGSTTDVTSTDATVTVNWARPVDNGGSAITAYNLYYKDSSDVINGGVANAYDGLSAATNSKTIAGLRIGEVYRFYVVAINAKGKSSASPTASIVAGTVAGIRATDDVLTYGSVVPSILDVQETAIEMTWARPAADSTGGTPISGYRIYQYEGVARNTVSDPDPVKQEIQTVTVSASSAIGGLFTLSYNNEETADIAAAASAADVKNALENLAAVGIVSVTQATSSANTYDWIVTFESDAGNLPSMKITSGRLTGTDASGSVASVDGSAATLVYDGTNSPNILKYTVNNLTPDALYAFKLQAINSVGGSILSGASLTTAARAGASPLYTSASGSALHNGIAGFVYEEQIVSYFPVTSCTDAVFTLTDGTDTTPDLCDVSAAFVEAKLELFSSISDVHVSKSDLTQSDAGVDGYKYTVTFIGNTGDVPMLSLTSSGSQGGVDQFDGSDAFVTEFLQGQSNEFIIEPKKASGNPLRDITASDSPDLAGLDSFYTELWAQNAPVDGSHTWVSNGGEATYNSVKYEIQTLTVDNTAATSFSMTLDTSTRVWGSSQTTTASLVANTVAADDIKFALEDLTNIEEVDVTSVITGGSTAFTVTFIANFGEIPLLSTSPVLGGVVRDQVGVAEVQKITTSADLVYVKEVQRIQAVAADTGFKLSFMGKETAGTIPCSSDGDAVTAITTIATELELLMNVTDVTVTANSATTPYQWDVTFNDPVGNVSPLTSDTPAVVITEHIQGSTPLGGTFVLSYGNVYTSDIPFDASELEIKKRLEALATIDEVDVEKVDLGSGFQWTVTFTKNLGNLDNIVAHPRKFEMQTIATSGGDPTPLDGSFTLSYNNEETGTLDYDASANDVKIALEKLSSIARVDVNQDTFSYGQYHWRVTFRSNTGSLNPLTYTSSLTGSNAAITVTKTVSGDAASLTGSTPLVIVEEKVAGLPSYSAAYSVESVGDYSLAVVQLQSGGLDAKYYDNQWLLDTPVIERTDATINFDWGTGPITTYGRDYVSARWWGKVKPLTTEDYTFYASGDDGVRLYIDHVLVIDSWDESSNENRATVSLTANTYHDIKMEYKEETGTASVSLQWSSYSVSKQVVNSDQLFFPTHIAGSPFAPSVVPGAADYPHSTATGAGLSAATAGELASFTIQAKDAVGNDKLTDGESMGDMVSPADQFTVEISGASKYTASVTYTSAGQYLVNYTPLKAGTYTVSVKTGGNHIYCGQGSADSCSPFDLVVSPGATVASTSEVASLVAPAMDSIVEGVAGEIGYITIQAKDTFGNKKLTGGDNFLATFTHQTAANSKCNGVVLDNLDGTYSVTYTIPMSGTYDVSISLDGETVLYCVNTDGNLLTRDYDGVSVYAAPANCVTSPGAPLKIIHTKLHAPSSVASDSGTSGLADAVVGIQTGFTIHAKDKFGNARPNDSTTHFTGHGDGKSDHFLVTLTGSNGYVVTTSSATQTVTVDDSSACNFKLSFAGATTDNIPVDSTPEAVAAALMSAHGLSDIHSVEVSLDDTGMDDIYTVTFTSHLDDWAAASGELQYVAPDASTCGTPPVVSAATKLATGDGDYPVTYTLWQKGTYEMAITSSGEHIESSAFMVVADDGAENALSSTATGQGLISGVAGDQFTFDVQAKDVRQPEVQVIKLTSTVAVSGGDFKLTYGNVETATIAAGANAATLESALEAISTVGDVTVNVIDDSANTNSIYWAVTFAPLTGGNICNSANGWANCPVNAGDVELITVSDNSLTYAGAASLAPVLTVFEVSKGSAGNNREDDNDLANIALTLTHDTVANLAIGMNEEQTITCDSSSGVVGAGSFDIYFTDSSAPVTVTGVTSTGDFQTALEGLVGAGKVTAASAAATVCVDNAVTTTTMSFTDKFTQPQLTTLNDATVSTSMATTVDAIDSIIYVSGGLYTVLYTPTAKGHYTTTLEISGVEIVSDLSSGVTVYPAAASGPQTTHTSNWFATEDETETFTIQATDRFGNELDSSVASTESYTVQLDGVADDCSGSNESTDSFAAALSESTPNTDGVYDVTYLPRLAGQHYATIALRSAGGLLATYYKNDDFTDAVLGNEDHLSFPYHETTWCPAELKTCDSTKLDTSLSFDWGSKAPVITGSADFPMDYFSVVWEGELKVDSSDTFTFSVSTDNKARLTIDGEVVVDSWTSAANTVSGTVALTADTFYAIKLEYVEDTADAALAVQFSSTASPALTYIPSANLFYKRNVGSAVDSTASPLPVTFVPGLVDATSTATGAGLTSCVANNQCDFKIQAKDSHGNNRYNSGADNFIVTLTGTDDWALTGRTNDVTTNVAITNLSPDNLNVASAQQKFTQLTGSVTATNNAKNVVTTADLTTEVKRGDKVVILGQVYTVDETATFDATNLPLSTVYNGADASSLDIFVSTFFDSATNCETGTHVVTYTPLVRGSYSLDIKIPMVSEVQRITTSVSAESALSGTFDLSFTDSTGTTKAAGLSFDISDTALTTALNTLGNIAVGDVVVTKEAGCTAASTCYWEVTFSGRANTEGDIASLVADTSALVGNAAAITITEPTKGVEALAISGSPFTLVVEPGATNAAFTTAYGQGLVAGNSNEVSTFYIQSKDNWGNNKLSSQDADMYSVLAFPEAGEAPELSTAAAGAVTSLGDGLYSVEYTPVTSGHHTVAVVLSTATEEQELTLDYAALTGRSGSFTLSAGNEATDAIAWDAKAEDVQTALESLAEFTSVSVTMTPSADLVDFVYLITFTSYVGNVKTLTVSNTDLVGGAGSVTSTVTEGAFQHIKTQTSGGVRHESQTVALTEGTLAGGDVFRLQFAGHKTAEIAHDATDATVEAALEALTTIDQVTVTKTGTGSGTATWTILFTPTAANAGGDVQNLKNFGNVPELIVADKNFANNVAVSELVAGSSPFRSLVEHVDSSAIHTTAVDQTGVTHKNGLSTAWSQSDTQFTIQSRDLNSNLRSKAALKEVQIIESSASANDLSGTFEVSYEGNSVAFAYNAGI